MKKRTFDSFVSYIEKYGNKPAYRYLQDGEVKEKSYEQMIFFSRSIASAFIKKGYRKRHIAILGPTSTDWISSYLGIGISGNVVIPLDRMLPYKEIVNLLRLGHVKTLLLGEGFSDYEEKLKNDETELEEITHFSSKEFQEMKQTEHENAPEVEEDEMVEIIFTSGTTGASKGVMLSQKNIISNVINLETSGFLSDKRINRTMSVLPIHHTFELTVNNLGALYGGLCVCINDQLENIMKNMQVFRPNLMLVVPMMAELFYKKLQENLKVPARQKRFQRGLSLCKKLRKMGIQGERQVFAEIHKKFGGELYSMIVGGAALREEVEEGLNQVGFSMYQGYGLTENSPVVCTNSSTMGTKAGSIGQLLPETKIRFDEGELLISGPSVMLGYYENPEATKETLDGEWLRTGDLGYQDKEGFIFLTGRKKNVIILDNGKNIFPEELEEHLSVIEGVKDVMVYEHQGKICAQFLLYPGTERRKVTEAVKEYNETMPTYKKITGVNFRTTEFPKTTTLKIKRKEVLRELEEKEAKKAEFVGARNDLEKKICMIFAQAFGMSRVSIDDDFFQLGGDSLKALEVAAEIGGSAQEIYDFATPRRLAEHIQNAEESHEPRVEDINERIGKSSQGRQHRPSHILLTGATGFLGAHMLERLLREDVKVTCLVRNPKKLKAILAFYFPKKSKKFEYQVVKGNIEEEHLGLSTQEYKTLCDTTDTVIHVAANVHHTGHYKDFERTNVIGTEHVIEFCKNAGAVLHHTSTASVSGAGTVKQKHTDGVFNEMVLDIGQSYEQNVYIHSKYKAEEKVILARQEGVFSNIYRIGNLTWRWGDGVFQKNAEDNGFVRRCKGLMKVGAYCKELDVFPIDFTPVDKCADAYIRLVMDGEMNRIYHMVNPNMYLIEDLQKKLHCVKVTKEAFEQRLLTLMPDRDVVVLSFYSMIATGSQNIPLDTKFTVKKLDELGFKWPKIKTGYLKHMLKIK
ncbi:MAG: AMP-binding protein [Lachnospiraceae bacterium]|nr:AMP-binding protein [Lachnospiraceae bacterium]